MNMTASEGDIDFKNRFEAGRVPPSSFHHRDHLRLVFVYLCESNTKEANARMRTSLRKFLQNNNVPPEKYHETVTYSWVQAVRHFMEKADRATSFDEFLAIDERLLDTEIMLSHYKKETLYADKGRVEFVGQTSKQSPIFIGKLLIQSGRFGLSQISPHAVPMTCYGQEMSARTERRACRCVTFRLPADRSL